MAAMSSLQIGETSSVPLAFQISEGTITAITVSNVDNARTGTGGTNGVGGPRDFDDELIVLVKAFPELYDQSMPNFKNLTRREGIWRNIAAKLHLTVDTCASRWKNLRDKYGRELKKRKRSGIYSPGFKQFNSLGFLQVHIRPRQRTNTFPALESSTKVDPSYVEDGEDAVEIDASDHLEIGTNEQLVAISSAENSTSKLPSTLNDCSAESNSSDYAHSRALRARKRVRQDVSTNEMLGELRQTQETFNGLATHLLSGIGSSQSNSGIKAPVRRIDTLCQLMEARYMSLPLDFQEEFDIEVLRLLRDCGRRANQKMIVNFEENDVKS